MCSKLERSGSVLRKYYIVADQSCAGHCIKNAILHLGTGKVFFSLFTSHRGGWLLCPADVHAVIMFCWMLLLSYWCWKAVLPQSPALLLFCCCFPVLNAAKAIDSVISTCPVDILFDDVEAVYIAVLICPGVDFTVPTSLAANFAVPT